MISVDLYEGSALLALDGTLPSHSLVASLAPSHTLLVAADGAAIQLRTLGIPPNVIVGDLDTIGPHLHDPFFSNALIIERPDQEEYDGAKSLQWIISEGYRAVTVLGAGGGMIDHVLNNFSLLARHTDRLFISVRDEKSVGYFITTDIRLAVNPGERISLIPMPSARLTTLGLAWNLREEALVLGQREGASNRAISEELSLTVQDGCVILFRYPAE